LKKLDVEVILSYGMSTILVLNAFEPKIQYVTQMKIKKSSLIKTIKRVFFKDKMHSKLLE